MRDKLPRTLKAKNRYVAVTPETLKHIADMRCLIADGGAAAVLQQITRLAKEHRFMKH